MAKVLVALSGGVDSSVAAALALEEGHEVVGAYMKNWINEPNIVGRCPWEEDIEDAREVAALLGIEFRVVNLIEAYRDRVVDYLLKGYAAGVTPNPDVMCNREIKFGAFLDYALGEGFEAVATGHYARRVVDEVGEVSILEGMDSNKDQTYFLALLQRNQIQRALFPIGDLPKGEVRARAHQLGLPTAQKKDSQGICFIGEVKMSDFLEHYLEDQPGEIVNSFGKVLGEHRGLHYYTLGQRRGIGVPSNTPHRAYVVVEKRAEANQLVVAFDDPQNEKLYARRSLISAMSFTGEPLLRACSIEAKPRYRSSRVAIDFEPVGENLAEGAWVTFAQPQRALTPGQICALYDGEKLLGGGIFHTIDYGQTRA